MGEDEFNKVHRPREVNGQRASALRFGDSRVVALFCALVVFRLLPRGFSNRDLREHLAPLLGLDLTEFSPGRMTYDLRRLRLHGFIERIPRSHRYQVTENGFNAAVFLSRAYAHLLRPGMAVLAGCPSDRPELGRTFKRLDTVIDHIWQEAA